MTLGRAIQACALALLLPACGQSDGRTPVLLVAVDGATWDVIDPLLARGELPHIASLVERGLRGPLLSMQPHISPAVWTTIVTGTFPRSHGILGFTYPFTEEVSPRSVSSDLRKDPALWNVASAYGLNVGTVGWYVTHPAEVVNGVMISDKLSGGPGTTHPERLGNTLAMIARDVGSPTAKAGLLRRILPWDYNPDDALDPTNPLAGVTEIVTGRLDSVCMRDEIVRMIALEALVWQHFDLFACYFRIVDHASHATWKAYDDWDFDTPVDGMEEAMLGDVIPAAYRVVDEAIGDLLEQTRGHVNIVVVSDHGFGSARDDVQMTDTKGLVLTGHHRPDGVFLAAGPDIAPGEIDGLTTLEIAPLLTVLLGLPLPDELPGRLEKRVFRPGFLLEHPVERVPRWEASWDAVESPGTPASDADEAETLRSLRALGYIGESTADPTDDSTGGGDGRDFWSSARKYRMSCLTGEISYALLRGHPEQAAALLELARMRDPDMMEELQRRIGEDVASMEAALELAPGSLVAPDALRALDLRD